MTLDRQELIPVTLLKEQWQALLNVVPVAAETYTPEGIDVLSAVAAIEHAIDPPQRERSHE